MQHKINKENLAIALKKSNLTFLEFLNQFVRHHVTKKDNYIDPQDTNVFTWIKNIYNNNQTHYEENTINTLSKVLKIDSKLLIQHNQIDLFNKDYEIFLRARVINYLKTQDLLTVKEFHRDINKDLSHLIQSI